MSKHVTRSKKPTNHTFHLIMSFLTCGIWAFTVWPTVGGWNAMGVNKKKSVTRERNTQSPTMAPGWYGDHYWTGTAWAPPNPHRRQAPDQF